MTSRAGASGAGRAKPRLRGLSAKKTLPLPLSSAGSVPRASPRAGVRTFFSLCFWPAPPLCPVWVKAGPEAGLTSVFCQLPFASPQGRPFGKRRPTRNPAPSPSRAALSQGQPTQTAQHHSSCCDTTHTRPTFNSPGSCAPMNWPSRSLAPQAGGIFIPQPSTLNPLPSAGPEA